MRGDRTLCGNWAGREIRGSDALAPFPTFLALQRLMRDSPDERC
jgi:hypothetical protein